MFQNVLNDRGLIEKEFMTSQNILLRHDVCVLGYLLKSVPHTLTLVTLHTFLFVYLDFGSNESIFVIIRAFRSQEEVHILSSSEEYKNCHFMKEAHQSTMKSEGFSSY